MEVQVKHVLTLELTVAYEGWQTDALREYIEKRLVSKDWGIKVEHIKIIKEEVIREYVPPRLVSAIPENSSGSEGTTDKPGPGSKGSPDLSKLRDTKGTIIPRKKY